MEYVENKVFIHIQSGHNTPLNQAPLWNVGETYFIGQKKNRFFEFFDHYGIKWSTTDIKIMKDQVSHTSKIIRELIFEEVRREFFPSHPSRQRGLWVINENDQESLNYWRTQLSTTDRIIKVELTGKIHVANQQYLKLSTDALKFIRQSAFHYWTGTSGARPEEVEILFEGFAKVIEVLPND